MNEVAANQETQNQRGQRDLELRSQELAAKNTALEEELPLRQQSQEEMQIARFCSSPKQLKVPLMLRQTKMWSS